MNYDEISALVVREGNDIVYVADPQTYQLLFVNRAGLELVGNPGEESWLGKPCYQILQNLDAPCEFCSNSKLSSDSFYCWEHYNQMLDRYFYLKDKLVELDGRPVRLEIAIDNTERILASRKLEKNLYTQQTLLACIRTLTLHEDLGAAVNELLGIVGEYYQGDRAYIFEYDLQNVCLVNTYEWCKAGVVPQIDNLQKVPAGAADRWLKAFREQGEFYISSVGKTVEKDSLEYEILTAQGIESLMAAPLWAEDQIIGFMGVDNPTQNTDVMLLLRSVAFFVIDDIRKRKLLDELRTLSYTDRLTGAANRNKYIERLAALEREPPDALGVLYVDINGLKLANDTYGHQYGDFLICHTAQILSRIFPDGVYRVGGDEFVVLCAGMSQAAFAQKVRELRRIAARDREFDSSVGMKWCGNRENVVKQVTAADELMYVDKQRYYRSRMDGRVSCQSGLLVELLREIDRGRFLLHFMAKRGGDGRLLGAVALVRRRDGQGNCQPISQFLPRYETEGIVRHLDFFALRTVCGLLKKWGWAQGEGPRVAVCFSRVTMAEDRIAEKLAAACAELGVSPGRVAIEVTEDIGKQKPENLRALFQSLRQAGFSISVDMFAAAYFSLSALAAGKSGAAEPRETGEPFYPCAKEFTLGAPLPLEAFEEKYIQ